MSMLSPVELLLLAAFACSGLATAVLAGWMAAARLHQRGLARHARDSARRDDHAAALRLFVAAERAWTPAILHPNAGNCQKALEEYAETIVGLAVAAGQLGVPLDAEPLRALVRRRITLINRALFHDVPVAEVDALRESFAAERIRFQQACDRLLPR